MKKRPAYDPAKIEKKWQKKWASSKIYQAEDSGAGKFYVLDMFPYPSGEGLHVGHPKGYIATDIVSRMKRMQGMNVLHPMGFDAFGLPAENYALKTKTHPEIAVKKNVARYKKQLELLGFDYDWSREVNTTDPKFYKWTQWIFLQLFKKGLAYESFEPINWCPSCKTGLANEDVEDGRCERCGTPVEKRPMRQWVLKITDYADRLLKDLDMRWLPNGSVFETLPNGEVHVVHTADTPGKVNPNKPFVEREAITAFVQHWSEDKFIVLKWKKVDWMTPITGGVEKGQTPEQAARAEILEETGFKNAELVKRADKRIHSTFFHPPKDENRVGHFSCLHFKLKDDSCDQVTADEQAKHEVTWISRSKMLETMTAEGQKLAWCELMGDDYGLSSAKPLLDWPESIKESQRNWIGRSEGAEIDFRLTLKDRKVRFVILHGFEGTAKTNFLPWLKSELEKRGHEVETPQLPNSIDPKESEQVEYVLKNCKFDENTVVIGHSLGAIVAMKALMKLGRPISGLTLVAAATPPNFSKESVPRVYHKNFDWNIDYHLINKLAQGRVAVLSDTKEEKRMPWLKFLAKELSAVLIETNSHEEHFCALQEPAILEAVTPKIRVFTTRPDTLFGVTYMVLAPEHHWVEAFLPLLTNKKEVEQYMARAKIATTIERTDMSKDKTGVELKGIKAVNPANDEEVPVWIADYVLADYGTGAVMAVPAHDERDAEFAKKFNLPVREIKLEDKEEMTKKFGTKVVRYKLRDWVFSRQRYWGEPIPLIHCEKCGVVAVPEKDLPVKLPKVESYEPTGTGESPLAAIEKWVNVKCPQCDGKGKRETNTMPQWAGSSWYYLRYEDPDNKKALVNPEKEKYWAPVDLYVGGAEHATRHLIYARFWHKFLYDIGVVSGIEPFSKLQSVGLIMGEDGKKMSKRFGNVINPDEIVATYGADTLRLYEMFMGPFDQQIAWSTQSMVGSRRFIERIWKFADKAAAGAVSSRPAELAAPSLRSDSPRPLGNSPAAAATRTIHKAIKKVTEDIGNLRFNTAVSALMIALNELEKSESVGRADLESYLKLIAPFVPHVAEELWSDLGNKKSIHVSEWPAYDPSLCIEDAAAITLQIDGKHRGSFTVPMGIGKEELEKRAKEAPEAKKWLENREIRRIVVIPDRLVNIVTVSKDGQAT